MCQPKFLEVSPRDPAAEASKKRKAPGQSSSNRTRALSLEELQENFHLPINEVAAKLGVCVTVLKQQCRELGIVRWPYRKVRKLDNMLVALESAGPTKARPFALTNGEAERQRKISIVKKTLEEVIHDPNSSAHLKLGKVKNVAAAVAAATAAAGAPADNGNSRAVGTLKSESVEHTTVQCDGDPQGSCSDCDTPEEATVAAATAAAWGEVASTAGPVGSQVTKDLSSSTASKVDESPASKAAEALVWAPLEDFKEPVSMRQVELGYASAPAEKPRLPCDEAAVAEGGNPQPKQEVPRSFLALLQSSLKLEVAPQECCCDGEVATSAIGATSAMAAKGVGPNKYAKDSSKIVTALHLDIQELSLLQGEDVSPRGPVQTSSTVSPHRVGLGHGESEQFLLGLGPSGSPASCTTSQDPMEGDAAEAGLFLLEEDALCQEQLEKDGSVHGPGGKLAGLDEEQLQQIEQQQQQEQEELMTWSWHGTEVDLISSLKSPDSLDQHIEGGEGVPQANPRPHLSLTLGPKSDVGLPDHSLVEQAGVVKSLPPKGSAMVCRWPSMEKPMHCLLSTGEMGEGGAPGCAELGALGGGFNAGLLHDVPTGSSVAKSSHLTQPEAEFEVSTWKVRNVLDRGEEPASGCRPIGQGTGMGLEPELVLGHRVVEGGVERFCSSTKLASLSEHGVPKVSPLAAETSAASSTTTLAAAAARLPEAAAGSGASQPASLAATLQPVAGAEAMNAATFAAKAGACMPPAEFYRAVVLGSSAGRTQAVASRAEASLAPAQPELANQIPSIPLASRPSGASEYLPPVLIPPHLDMSTLPLLQYGNPKVLQGFPGLEAGMPPQVGLSFGLPVFALGMPFSGMPNSAFSAPWAALSRNSALLQLQLDQMARLEHQKLAGAAQLQQQQQHEESQEERDIGLLAQQQQQLLQLQLQMQLQQQQPVSVMPLEPSMFGVDALLASVHRNTALPAGLASSVPLMSDADVSPNSLSFFPNEELAKLLQARACGRVGL